MRCAMCGAVIEGEPRYIRGGASYVCSQACAAAVLPARTASEYVVTVKVKSATGERPLVRTLGGDTVFIGLVEGMTATWELKRLKLLKP